MSALTVYKTALESLAAQGNAEAALALKIGENVGDFDLPKLVSSVCEVLSNANMELDTALQVNSDRWSTSTDRAVNRARVQITKAFTLLAER
jgi:hypothetical protein